MSARPIDKNLCPAYMTALEEVDRLRGKGCQAEEAVLVLELVTSAIHWGVIEGFAAAHMPQYIH